MLVTCGDNTLPGSFFWMIKVKSILARTITMIFPYYKLFTFSKSCTTQMNVNTPQLILMELCHRKEE